MVSFFPDLYPDELLYSACARYADRLKYPNQLTTFQRLFGYQANSIPMFLPTSLNYFLKSLPENHNYTATQIINGHTLLPFYSSFLASRTPADLRNAMLNFSKLSILTVLGKRTNLALPSFLRYCPKCLKNDRKKYGEGYWHRLHQAPGMEVCLKHDMLLEKSTVPSRERKLHKKFISAEANIEKHPNEEDIDPQNRLHCELRSIAENVTFLFHDPLPIVTQDIAAIRYLNRLHKMNLVLNNRLKAAQLVRLFREHYSDEFLTRLECAIPAVDNRNWLTGILTLPHSQFSPIQHMLVIQFLGLTAKEFFELKENNLTYNNHGRNHTKWFGDGPWSCLNPECSHFSEQCIETYDLKFVGRKRQPKGYFTCRYCNTTYFRFGTDETVTNEFIGQVVMHIAVERNREKETSENLIVQENTPSDRVKKHRDILLQAIKLEPNITRQKLVEKGGPIRTAYFYIKEHDRVWFSQNIPERQPSRLPNDKKAIDSSTVEKLPGLLEKLKQYGGKPKQITYRRLLWEAGITNSDLLGHADDLEKSILLAKELAETRVEFGLRCLAWATRELRGTHPPPSRTQLVFKASIRGLVSNPEIAEALDKALIDLQQNQDKG